MEEVRRRSLREDEKAALVGVNDKGMDSSHVKMDDEEIVEGFLLGYFLGDVFEVKLEFHRLSGG